MRKLYVRFESPGTYYAEITQKPIDARDVDLAVRMSRDVVERYSAKPYGFRFVEYMEHEPIDDGEGGTLQVQPRKVGSSGFYHLGGRILRFDDIPDTKENAILRDNMRSNRIPLVVENCNSWRSTHPFEPEDTFLPTDGGEIRLGNEQELEDYRKKKCEEWQSPLGDPGARDIPAGASAPGRG